MRRLAAGISFLIWTCFLALLPAATLAKSEKTQYTMGILLKTNTGIDGQYKVLFTDIMKVFSEKGAEKIDLKFYSDPDMFISDAEKNVIDFAMSTTPEVYYEILRTNSMTPFMSEIFFGRRENRYCLFAKKEKKFNGLEDLKNKRVLTYGERDAYYALKKLLKGDSPSRYFILKEGPSAFSMIYSLGLDDVDAIFVNDANVDYFKKTNPGPVKNIEPVACLGGIWNVPIMRSRRAPDSLVKKLREFGANFKNEPLLAKYKPLMKQMKFSFCSASRENYNTIINLMDEGSKSGWLKEFDVWMKYQRR